MPSKYKYIYDKLHELIQNLLSKKNTDVPSTCRLLYWVTVLLHP